MTTTIAFIVVAAFAALLTWTLLIYQLVSKRWRWGMVAALGLVGLLAGAAPLGVDQYRDYQDDRVSAAATALVTETMDDFLRRVNPEGGELNLQLNQVIKYDDAILVIFQDAKGTSRAAVRMVNNDLDEDFRVVWMEAILGGVDQGGGTP